MTAPRFSLLSGALPPGLTLNRTTGAITGIPATLGTYPFTVRILGSTQSLSLSVVSSLAITTAALPNGVLGSAYSTALSASGGLAPYAYEIASGSLPDGLTLASDGTITGTPTTAATSTVTIRVTDSSSVPQTATRELSLWVLLFDDEFDDAVMSLSEASGNGTAAEIGDGTLTLSIAGGSDGNWWTFGRYCRYAYAPVPAGGPDLIAVEAQFNSATGNGSDNAELLVLRYDDTNAFLLFTNDGTQAGAQRLYSGGETDLGVYVTALAFPLRVRFLWDRNLAQVTPQVYGSGAWHDICAAQAVPFTVADFGLAQKTYGTYPATVTHVEYLRVYAP
jgi:hypothetical protein